MLTLYKVTPIGYMAKKLSSISKAKALQTFPHKMDLSFKLILCIGRYAEKTGVSLDTWQCKRKAFLTPKKSKHGQHLD